MTAVNDGELRDLLTRYQQLKDMPKGAETHRGQRFNLFLRDLLRAWGLEAHSDQRGIRNRDETDVGFSVGRAYYILEAKWERKPINLDPVAKLYLRLKVRPPGTAAVLVSMSGFTKHVHEFTEYHPEITLLDRTHIEAMLTGLVDPDQLLHLLFSWTSRRGGSHVPLERLMLNPYPPELPRWTDPSGKPGVSYLADGVCAQALLVTDEPPALTFTGMTATAYGAMLLTCDQGVMRLDPDTRKTNWEFPLSGCSGSALLGSEASFFTACESAVVRWDSRALTAVAGAFKPHSQLLAGPDGERWMFSTTGPTGRVWNGSHTLTRLGSRAGRRNLTRSSSAARSGRPPSPAATPCTSPPATSRASWTSPMRCAWTSRRIRTRRSRPLPATALTARDGVYYLLLHAWDSDWRPHTALTRPVLLRIELPGSTA